LPIKEDFPRINTSKILLPIQHSNNFLTAINKEKKGERKMETEVENKLIMKHPRFGFKRIYTHRDTRSGSSEKNKLQPSDKD